MDKRTDGWMDGWVDGWMGKGMDRCTGNLTRSYVEAPSMVSGTEKSFSVCEVGCTKSCYTPECRDSCLHLRLTFWNSGTLMENQDTE